MAASPPTLPTQVAPPSFGLGDGPLLASGGPGAVVAVPVLPGDDSLVLGPGAAELVEETGLDLLAILEHHEATGRAGEVVSHPVTGDDRLAAVLCVGVGEGTPSDLRRAGAEVARAARGRDLLLTTVPLVAGDEGLRPFVVGAFLGSFEFHWRSRGARTEPVRRVLLVGAGGETVATSGQAELDRAVAIAMAGWRSRALAATPSNLKNPAWLADQAAVVADEAGLRLKVWDERDLAAGGFGGLLGVGAASATPPRLIRLDYRPGRRRAPHVVLVGKGITFDTGGLSIKPGEAMVNMKRDMTGGGVVIAAMGALAAVGCQVRVTGLVAAAENAVGGSALRPGDVITHFGGRTSEVTNTDAEGRLVLADALAYAVAELNPDVVVDVATLTGAMKVALGLRTGGYFANNDVLAESIAAAGEAAGEPLWRMPLAADYEEKLASKVADADNGAGTPGAITAALFLQHFVGGLPWAHLDVASVGDSPEENAEWTAGPTGFGVRALLQWLEQDEPTKGL